MSPEQLHQTPSQKITSGQQWQPVRRSAVWRALVANNIMLLAEHLVAL